VVDHPALRLCQAERKYGMFTDERQVNAVIALKTPTSEWKSLANVQAPCDPSGSTTKWGNLFSTQVKRRAYMPPFLF